MGRRVVPIRYAAGHLEVEVHGFPDHGMATIWDSDVLIWAASQLVEAANRGLETSRLFRFTPTQLRKRLVTAADIDVDCRVGQAARAVWGAAQFQGRSRAIRLIGWAAMRVRTSAR